MRVRRKQVYTSYLTTWNPKPILRCSYGPESKRMPGKNYWLMRMPLLVRRYRGRLQFKRVRLKEFKPTVDEPGHLRVMLDSRINSIKQQITETEKKYGLKNFDWVSIQLSDGPNTNLTMKSSIPILTPCAWNLSLEHPFIVPDPTWWDWPQAHITSYQDAINIISQNGNIKVENQLMGWRGSGDYGARKTMVERYSGHPNFNFKSSAPPIEVSDQYIADKNFIHLFDQVKMWRYFLDLRGATYSSRTKYLLFSKRVVFIQHFVYKEWFYNKLQPWIHYVPLKDDLSDLEENYNIVRDNPHVEELITNSAYQFAINNLTFDHALQRWHTVINNL